MKKLKLRNFLFKYLIMWLIIGVVLCTVGIGVTVSGIYTVQASMAALNSAEAVSALKDSKSDIHSGYILSVFFDSGANLEMHVDSAAVLCDSETGEIVADSKLGIYAVVPETYSPTGEVLFLRNKSEDLYETVLNISYLYGYDIILDVSEIYIDGDGFYPGNAVITRVDHIPPVNPLDEPIEKDFTPEDVSAYTELNEHFRVTAIGTNPESKVLNEVIRDYEKSGKKSFSEFTESEDFRYNYSNGMFKNIIERGSFKIGDKTYDLFAYYSTDVWGLSGAFLIVICAILLFICICIAVLVSYNKYRKYITQYEIDEYRRNMTNALAHDLKSPLTAIYGYAENLKDNVHGEKREYYADAVLENVRYMNDIITNTLDLAKLEIGEKGVKQEKLDIAAISDELYKKYRPQAESRNIFFTANGSCTVTADKTLLTQALENLISNAVKFTSDNGRIEVTVSDRNYTITNDCDKSLKTENIGKPFGKSDKSRSNRTGSGLGLSIVKNITALHKFGFVTKAENGKFTAEITFGNK